MSPVIIYNVDLPIPSAVVTPSPQMVQLVGSDTNDNNGLKTGNNYVFNMPNATQAGNCIVLFVSYPFSAGRTVTIVDSTGDTWPAATRTVGAASAGNLNTKIFVLPNASAGLHTLTLTFDAGLFPFQYTMAEFYNCVGADGSNGANSVSGPNIAAGSYTPTSTTDAHMIFSYAMSNDTVGTLAATQATAMSATNSASLAHACNISTIPSVSSIGVLAAGAGAINPGFSITQASTTTNFVVSSVALKVGNVGALPAAGIRIKRLLHYSDVNPVNGNNDLLFPCDGNLLVMTMAASNNLNPLNGVTDSNGQTYAARAITANESSFFDKVNATPSNSLVLHVSLNGAGQPQFSVHLWDIVGAAAAPFDTRQGFDGSAPGSGTVMNDVPDITPTVAPGLTIVQLGLGTASQGAMASGAPPGAVFDCVSYNPPAPGASPGFDQDRMDNADPFGHVNYSTTAQQTWNWVITADSHGSTLFGTAVCYHS